jgi:tRNA G18 (ribose-2'-O)-methylase SpoU
MEKGSFSFFENLKLNRIYDKLSRPIIIADGLKSPENMGSILRLAGNIGAQHTIFISEIAHEFRKYKIRRTACGALENSSWQIITNVGQVAELIPPDYDCVALETTDDAVDIFSFQFSEKTAFIVGSEGYGISDQLLAMVHHKLYIPLPGNISSLNVTHALSIALFEWLRQMNF